MGEPGRQAPSSPSGSSVGAPGGSPVTLDFWLRAPELRIHFCCFEPPALWSLLRRPREARPGAGCAGCRARLRPPACEPAGATSHIPQEHRGPRGRVSLRPTSSPFENSHRREPLLRRAGEHLICSARARASRPAACSLCAARRGSEPPTPCPTPAFGQAPTSAETQTLYRFVYSSFHM